MFNKILVPLDGSKLAECALPYAETLAQSCGTEEVILVSVTERVAGHTYAPEYREVYQASQREDVYGAGPEIGLIFGKMEKQANRYLERIAKQLSEKGIRVVTQVALGDPAEKIAESAETSGAEVIVMSSHGRSGPSRWAHGSVAEKVFRASCVPVLMIRAPGCNLGV
jgi:nucleotide-binding universal stress UspA family protein